MTLIINKYVYIGRFQPYHKAHEFILKKALSNSMGVILVLGSDNSSRSIQNPWYAEEREVMIRHSLSTHENMKLEFIRQKDVPNNNLLWAKQINEKLEDRCWHTTSPVEVSLIGCRKDDSSFYLNLFPTLQFKSIELRPNINATDIRNSYFREDPEEFWSKNLPTGSLKFLKGFRESKDFKELVSLYRPKIAKCGICGTSAGVPCNRDIHESEE
jgi:bifunctional NMN adenylyltransferase/nudix hydrolase